MPYTLMQTEVAIRNNLLLTGGPYVFEQAIFQRQVGNGLLQGTRLAAKVLHFAARSSACSVARQPPLAGFQEFLRPGVVEALCNPFLAAELSDAVLAAKAIQHDPDLVFR